VLAPALLAVLLGAGVQPAAGAPPPPPEVPDVGETVVTGTRAPRPAADLPTTVLVIGREELQRAAATTVDAALRRLPSFATLRRSTSLVADPSSQGLNLRGVAPSAVSRALLVDDGVPVNDPFAGWVAWRAVPRLALDRIEVAPGGASALYGSFALGGVVALVPREITGPALEVESAGGTPGTYELAAHAADRRGVLAGALDVETAGTDGYVVVAPEARGAIDRRAHARHATVSGRLVAERGGGPRLTLGGAFFDEDQDGGTRFTRAAARALTGRVGLAWRSGPAHLSATAFGGTRRFTQDRARVAADRSTEAHAAAQEVPSTDAGLSLLASVPARAGHSLSAGMDLRAVAGTSEERLFPASTSASSTISRDAGGRQWTGGLFAQDAWEALPGLELAGALRLDLWRSDRGRTLRRAADGTADEERFDARSRAIVSPRVALRWTASPAVTVRASAYRAFRAPTLNELYRAFQVGTVLTAPNPALEPETLIGAETGPEISLGGALRVRAAAFWNVLADGMTIATLPSPLPDGATRQRVNLGRIRVRGVETDATLRFAPLEATLAWTHTDARVTSSPGFEALQGKRLAHDPPDRVTARLVLDDVALAGALVEVRWTARAFEDDLERLPLPAYAVVDLGAWRALGRAADIFVELENALDRAYLAGRAGVETIGAPRTVRAGLRVRLGDAR
jgi:outer membrane receptor protein involved in Fe transport